MNLDDKWVMNEQGRHKECKCDVCKKWVDEFNVEILEDLQVCFSCNNLAMLRLDGFLKSASDTVRQLVA